MATYLITGASRGIGLELTRQLAELPTSQVSKIFAVVRKVDSKDVQQLVDSHPERVIPISASVDDTASVKKAAETVKSRLNGQGLDVLVNNAGVSDFSTDGIKSMDIDRLSRTLDVNVVGVHRVTAAFMPLLEQGTEKKIINISSGIGSFAYNHYPAVVSMPMDSYIISKAALNMLTLRYAKQYADAGFTIAAISPGWIRTDMGTEQGDLSVEEGVAQVKRVILESGKEQNGRFLNISMPKTDKMVWEYNGEDIAW